MPSSPPYSRYNALDQVYDVGGSDTQVSTLSVADEGNLLGSPVSPANTGTQSLTVTVASPTATISGMTGGLFTANSVGNWVTFSGFSNSANNGTFLIITYISSTSVTITNASAVAEGPTPSVTWTERYAYSLQDDLNYERSDRTSIKGVSYALPVPTYYRPTATTTTVPANLSNIAMKTTDAVSYNINRGFFDQPLAPTYTIVYATGQLHHSQGAYPPTGGGDNNLTGVPCFDDATGGPFAGDWNSCYVEVTDYATGNELYVLAGAHIGEKIFGETYNGNSTSPNSVQINWYSCPNGENIATNSTAYTWEKGSANSNTGTTPAAAVTVVPDAANGTAAVSGITGATFTSGSVGNWVTFSGFTASGNNGTFLITSYTSATSITIFNPAAVAASPDANAITWTEYVKSQPDFVNLTYGYNERLDGLDINAFRFPLVSGLTGDADLRFEINNILEQIGTVGTDTNIGAYLTNTGNYYAFSDLGTATPSVITALNTLNAQIGNRTYTGPYLTDGQTITASLQALSNAIGSSTVTRYIERLTAALPANTAHTLPGGATYTLDGTNNGRYLWVYWAGLLRDPGTVANGDDYMETSTTSITPYSKIKSGVHVEYFVL